MRYTSPLPFLSFFLFVHKQIIIDDLITFYMRQLDSYNSGKQVTDFAVLLNFLSELVFFQSRFNNVLMQQFPTWGVNTPWRCQTQIQR